MDITYIGGHDAQAFSPAGGRECRRGESIDVLDELAGRPPAPRVAELQTEIAVAYAARDDRLVAALAAELAATDHGAGLLAQADTWRLTHDASPAGVVESVPTNDQEISQ